MLVTINMQLIELAHVLESFYQEKGVPEKSWNNCLDI